MNLTTLQIARKIKDLKPGQSFVVDTKKEQWKVCTSAKTLRDAGVIDFAVSTRQNTDGKFTVFAF